LQLAPALAATPTSLQNPGACRLPRARVALLAAVVIVGHDALDGIGVAPPGERGVLDGAWSVLHVRTVTPFQAMHPRRLR
jgi:hypothetical protein